MTYRELQNLLSNLSESQLDCDVTILDTVTKEYGAAIAFITTETDMLDIGQPFLEF